MSIYVTVKDANTGKVIDIPEGSGQWVIHAAKGQRFSEHEAEIAVVESLAAHKFTMTPAVRAKCEFDSFSQAWLATVIVPGKARRTRRGNALTLHSEGNE